MRSGLLLSLAVFSGAAFAQGTAAAEPRLAIKGYDPVAYFTEQKPVKGAAEFREDFDGSRYYFSSASNRKAFAADPERYAPQFAGLCAVSMGKGRRFEADPTAWRVIDGKLYVFGSAQALEQLDKDPSLLDRSRQAWRDAR
jgi:YHS domain-containing protein